MYTCLWNLTENCPRVASQSSVHFPVVITLRAWPGRHLLLMTRVVKYSYVRIIHCDVGLWLKPTDRAPSITAGRVTRRGVQQMSPRPRENRTDLFDLSPLLAPKSVHPHWNFLVSQNPVPDAITILIKTSVVHAYWNHTRLLFIILCIMYDTQV